MTKIEWTDTVWNVVHGCTKVSAGCKHCYAERMSKRLAGRFGYPKDNPFAVTCRPDRLDQPSKWRKPRRAFVASMGDLFHEDVPDSFIFAVFMAMSKTRGRGHVFQVLTKRPERMRELLSLWVETGLTFHEGCTGRIPSFIWCGVSVEDQATADERIPILLDTPAAVRFVSCEPLLGPVDLHMWDPEHPKTEGEWMASVEGVGVIGKNRPLDWVIVGSESGSGRRECDLDWIRSIRDQCAHAAVPFFLKQIHVDGKKVSLPELDGVIHEEWPAQCRPRRVWFPCSLTSEVADHE